MKRKKFYIATSIVYTNAPPHIGFALELIQADLLARYNRTLKRDVFFLTGTDEHGRKVVEAAQKAGKSPQKFTNEISTQFKALKKVLNLSNNDFIRTTDKKRHWPVVKKIWLELKKRGDIYKKKYRGLYCLSCEAFVLKKDLKDEKCIIHQKKPEFIEEENYFFRLSKYQKEIKNILTKRKIKIIPQKRKNEILNFLKEGLEDISFSRPRKNLKWAIPVPDDASASIYVWADALINYLSAVGYIDNKKKFKEFWPIDIHCIGKDILKFHCLIWPAMLLALKLPLPKTIFVHGFITIDGQKMSKSLGNVIDPFKLVEKYGTDAVRYFLLREIPSTEDGDFSYQKFEERYNADLANGLGNLVARVITLAKNSKSQITNFKQIPISKFQKKYKKALEEFEFNEALITIWELISFCDKYIEKEKPWKKTEKQKGVINNLLFTLKNIAQMLEPFLPKTSENILEQIKTKKSKILFPRI
jgi:methionyl-tRNA synthetase